MGRRRVICSGRSRGHGFLLDVLLLQVCLEVGGLAEIQGGSTDDSLQELLFLYEGGIAVTVGGSVVSSSCVRSSVVDGRWAVIDIPAVIHFQVLLQVVLVIHVKVTVPREREETRSSSIGCWSINTKAVSSRSRVILSAIVEAGCVKEVGVCG